MKIKLKATTDKIKPKVLYITFAAALVISTALRFYHSVKLIDTETGFYAQSDFTVALFYCVLILAGLFFLISSFVSSENRTLDEVATFRKNIPLGITSLFLSFAFLAEALQSTVNSLEATVSTPMYGTSSTYSQLMKNGYLPYVLSAVFAILSSLYFLILAVNCFKSKCKVVSKKIFALVPVVWTLVKLISFFVKQISFMRVSSLVLEIAALIFASIFLFSFAQCTSGVYADVAQWRLTGVGLTASLFLLMLNVPKIVFTFVSSGKYIVTDYPVSYAELLLGVFILILIVSLEKRHKNPETSYEDTE